MITNYGVATATQVHPDQLVGIASIDLPRSMHTVRELRRCAPQFGFKGVSLLPWLLGVPPDDRLDRAHARHPGSQAVPSRDHGVRS